MSSRAITCPSCGIGSLCTGRIPYDVSFRDRAYTIPKAEVTLCDSCGEVFFAPGPERRSATRGLRRGPNRDGPAHRYRDRPFPQQPGPHPSPAGGRHRRPGQDRRASGDRSVCSRRAADRFLRVLMAHPGRCRSFRPRLRRSYRSPMKQEKLPARRPLARPNARYAHTASLPV